MKQKPLEILLLNLIVWALFLMITGGSASAQTFNPGADAYTYSTSPSVNFGTTADLQVKMGATSNYRKAYVKFDLTSSGIPAITSAVLRLYATTSTAITMNVFQVQDNWTETGITWNNAPAEGSLITSAVMTSSPGYIEWDVTTYVQSQFSSGDKIISLEIYSATVSSGTISFSSRDAAANNPQLVIIPSATTPATPSGLAATAVSYSQVNLTWNDNSGNESGFKVERKTGTGSYTEIASLAPNSNSYNNTGLTPSTSYTYRVYAYNGMGNSAYSNESSATTAVAPPLPAAPSNLVATTVSPSELNLQWADNSSTEEGFKIESKTGNGSFTEIATVGPNVTTYTNSGLLFSTAYSYRIRAYNISGNSAYSNEASATTLSPPQITYYVDDLNGVDANNGLSPATAWKNLSKVNATTFSANNKILFKANGVWTGRLYPKGSGAAGFPVIIDMYGTGNKPLIDGNGMTGTGVVYLYNQQYWEINNLEITNDGSADDDRRGVRIEAENYGTANHIYLKNLNIHDVHGSVGQNRSDKRTSAIGYGIVDVSVLETHFNDILVENCVITNCSNEGIITECVPDDGFDPYSAEWNSMKITNAAIRNNTISNISKNAMIIRLFEGGTVENNVCYNTANGITGNTIFSASCSGTVFQYNEGYDNNSPDYDGSLYDPDLRSPNTYWQYSYSHDNAHGLFWNCTVQADVNVVCRYNISQNDHGVIFCVNYPVTSLRIYNNTVYIPSTQSPLIISERNTGGGTRTYTFNNNLIYNLSTSAAYDWTSGYSRSIDYNCFYGIHPSTEPSDAHKVTADPKLVSPGSGGNGINSVSGYKLQVGSSCINTGKTISNNGGKDYWGNVLYNGAADIGANEYTLPPSAPTSLNAVPLAPSQINLSWTDNSSNETGFRIERKSGTGAFIEIGINGAGVTTFSNTGITPNLTYTYRVRAYNASGNSAYSNEATATLVTMKNLNIRLFLEGLYTGRGTLRKAQDESGDHFPGTKADEVTVELHDASNYNSVVYTATLVGVDTSGYLSLVVPAEQNGSYYISIRHRNSITTTTAAPVSFSPDNISYNFTDNSNKSYGGNQMAAGDGKFCLYGGDASLDDLIDGTDMALIDNGAGAFSTGYIPEDVNGDGLIDGSDMAIADNNAAMFISASLP